MFLMFQYNQNISFINYIQKHQNHNCYFTTDVGICVCGQLTQLQNCEDHQILEEQTIAKIEMISVDLAQNIEQFFITSCSIYLQVMKQIEIQWNNYRLPIMQLYHLCQKFKINKLIQTIDKKINYQNYYKLLLKSQYLHQMIFNFIDWLTEDRKIFQNLIANIFQKQLPNSAYSLYEDLIRNQALQEAISPEPPIVIGYLIQRLTSNSVFFEFVCRVNLRIFSNFFLLAKNAQTKSVNTVYQYIDVFNQLQEHIDPQYVQNNKKQIDEMNNIVEKYLQELKLTDFTSQSYIQCESIIWFKDSTNEIVMKTIVEQLDNVQVFNFLENFYCLIHLPLGQLSCYPWDGIKYFGSKFRSEKFDKFNMISLKNALGVDYDKFKNQNSDLKIIKNFNHEKYILTKLINCLGKAKPSNIPNNNFDYKLTIDEDEELKDYIHFEGEVFKEIETGMISLFSDPESNEQLKINFIQVILVQTYNLIKNKRNVGVRFENLLSQIFSQYVNQKDDFNIKMVKARKIYCSLKKNASILDKLFIQILCLHFSIKEYSQPQQFLQFLQSILDDSIEVIKENFQQILQRCILNYISVWIMVDDKLDQMYYGYGENNYRLKLESIDTAFGKLYIYLFGEIGLLDIYRAINNMLIPDISLQYTVTNLYLLRLVTSDLDIYNLSIFYFREQDNLPTVLKQALQKIIQNIMNFEVQTTFETIQLRFEDLGINFLKQKNYILNFLELDETTKLLKLKNQYPPIYDPILFVPKADMKKMVVQKLNERGMQNKDLLFGNGLLLNIQLNLMYQLNFNQLIFLYNLLQNHMMKKIHIQFKRTYSIICPQNKILQIIYNFYQNLKPVKKKPSSFFIIQCYRSIFSIQIIAASYFRPEELKSNKILILQLLNQLFHDSQFETNKQKYAILIEQFTTFSFLKNDQSPIKMVAKLNQGQMQQNDHINELQKIDYQQCDGCKLQIQDKFCFPILLSKKSNYKHQPLPDKLISQLIKKNYNLIQLSVNGCSHKYHPNCLMLNLQQQQFFIQLPRWYKQVCRLCNHSFNLQMPLHKSITQLEVQLFNKSLVDNANECGLWDYLVTSNQNQNQNIIIELYLQIIIDLLQQLFIDIKRFIDLNRTIVLNQIIYLLEQTIILYQSLPLKIQPKVYNFDTEISILFNILQSIYNNIIITLNKQQLKKEIIIVVLNLKQDQYKQTLLDIFSISTLEVQEYNDQSRIQIVESDPYIEYNQQIFDIYKQKLNSFLGQNFAEFHKKYFTKGCDICKYYNVQFENSKDILVCLICQKVFCMKQCTKTKFGNLNEHALQEHSGGSFYVSLITGQITLIQHPISLHSAYDLFYNEKFGLEQISSVEFEEWSMLLVDQLMINKIVEIMIHNQFGVSICNKKVEKSQDNIQQKQKMSLTTDGSL